MKENQKVKALAKLGKQKEPTWHVGRFVSQHSSTECVVEIAGKEFYVDTKDVIAYNTLTEEAIESHGKETVDQIQQAIQDLLAYAFPNKSLKVERDSDNSLHIDNRGISVYPGVVEKRTIRGIQEVVGWTVNTYKTFPTSRWEPEDVDVVEQGAFQSWSDVANKVAELIFKNDIEGFWGRKADEAYAEQVERDRLWVNIMG